MKINYDKYFLIILFILLLGLSSCDEYSDYSIGIINNSSDTISIYYSGTTAYRNGVDTVVVFPNRENIYYNAEGRTIKSKNFDCDPQISENEVTIKTSSNRILSKEIWEQSNWECDTDRKNTFYNMTFTISETDLISEE